MTILVTGGTGNIGGALARLLQAANYPLIISSRKGVAEPFKAVKFDWSDPSTFENPFNADPNIDRVFVIAPISGDALEQTKPFFKVAIEKGVKRFVLITATQAEKGDNSQYGKVHEHLANLGVEYTVLRPTWFIENFGQFSHTIRENDEILSVTGKGRIPFVSVQDIAKAAFDALTAEKSANTDYFVIGPELWSYDDVAAALTEVTGRKIVHRLISLEEQLASFKLWMDEEYAIELNTYEGRIASGIEEKNVGHPKAITGKHKLRDYLEANKQLWSKA
ncbi:hypothetical protein NLJ89_g5377 [Agrocybe chaxingu]|uniref:NmrA-like domain-containing protein n=1 Tax=Agrocybe chaxingu TaxID=84603 RepID=A0A9W8K149_9AGAR|nr:hypothetical protein NLJ89_g5377 [Agrocybe chaxingu]